MKNIIRTYKLAIIWLGVILCAATILATGIIPICLAVVSHNFLWLLPFLVYPLIWGALWNAASFLVNFAFDMDD